MTHLNDIFQLVLIVATIWLANKSSQKHQEERFADAIAKAMGGQIAALETRTSDTEEDLVRQGEKVHGIDLRLTTLETRHAERHPVGGR